MLTDLVERCCAAFLGLLLLIGCFALTAAAAGGAGGGTVAGALTMLECSSVTSRESSAGAGAAAAGAGPGATAGAEGAVTSLILRSSICCGLCGRWTASGISLGGAAAAAAAESAGLRKAGADTSDLTSIGAVPSRSKCGRGGPGDLLRPSTTRAGRILGVSAADRSAWLVAVSALELGDNVVFAPTWTKSSTSPGSNKTCPSSFSFSLWLLVVLIASWSVLPLARGFPPSPPPSSEPDRLAESSPSAHTAMAPAGVVWTSEWIDAAAAVLAALVVGADGLAPPAALPEA